MIATKTDIAKLLQRIEKLEEQNASFPYIEPSQIIEGLHQELNNKQAIIKILDLLIDYCQYDDETRRYKIGSKAAEMKREMEPSNNV
jgi:hypothetical protein